MRNEIRTAVYDSTLRIEACRFAGPVSYTHLDVYKRQAW